MQEYNERGLSCLIIIISIISTTLAKSNGSPGSIIPRRYNRRAVGISEFLTPPAPPAHRNRLSLPSTSSTFQSHNSIKAPYRHGKILNPPSQHPVAPNESSGYFSRLMSWLNPFSGPSQTSSLPQQPLPPPRPPPPPHNLDQSIHNGDLKPPPLPPQATQYQPPAEHSLPKPPAPPTGQSYLPPLSGKNCDTCNTVPWIPLPQASDVRYSSAPSRNNLPYTNDNIDLKPPSQSYEIKPLDFGYGPPQSQHEIIPQASNSHHNIDNSQTQYTSTYTGPIPNPHLYPGAIPPLYKATAFNIQSEPSNPIPSGINNEETSSINSQSISDSSNHNNNLNLNAHPSESSFPPLSTSDNANLDSSYVDVLPPSAEVILENENFPPNHFQEIHHDNGGSSSNFQQVLHHTDSEQASSVSLQPTIDTPSPTDYPLTTKSQKNNYGTKLSSDGQHIFHIEESPVIDLSTNDKKLNNASVSSSSGFDEASVILQNSDGTYGINATIPNAADVNYNNWSLDSETEGDLISSTLQPFEISINEQIDQNPINHRQVEETNSKLNSRVITESPSQNVSSLLLGVFQNINNNNKNNYNLTGFKQNSLDVNSHLDNHNLDGKQAEVNSELNLRLDHMSKEEVEAKRSRLKFNARDIQSGAGFTPSFGVRNREENNQESFVPSFTQVNNDNNNRDEIDQQRGMKKNKQVQIIIPYTSQYTPSPFHPSNERGNVEVIDKTRGRKVPVFSDDDRIEDTRIGNEDINKLSHILQALNGWPKVKDAMTKSNNVKVNTSIDVLRLQKNIDNWTIQEYSRGTTASTESPIISHPHLSQSKQIPDEYFTTTEPVPAAGTIREIEKIYGNVLSGFNYNDLEHEGSASSRVDTPSIRVSSFEREDPSMSSELDSTTEATTNSLTVSSAEDNSWEQLPVSISPLSNERVYVVTPQSILKSSQLNSSIKINNEKNIDANLNNNSTNKFESIERAYQVLPEAVNNLAVASTGPATIPLWGIMEHEQYALAMNKTNSTMGSPILYSGHSKVSRTRQ
ncbi:hypothetical protein PV327_001217 [Microctonus hyperodae]|uniref:Uncharacterized protein n=1 Tax=Microctonus hyperodae TaxID=165561 RepID=A0AA39G841_MICHY|nr:hypothetical protein PV327_001217 [Microctonus hyperodae]